MKPHDAAEPADDLPSVLARRPVTVLRACILQILTAVMTLVTTMNGYAHYVDVATMLGRPAGSFEQFLVSRGASVVVTLLLALCFYQGRNWARMLYVFFFVVNAIFIAWSVGMLGNQVLAYLWQMDALINLLQIVISFVICCLLLSRASSTWFRQVRAARARRS